MCGKYKLNILMDFVKGGLGEKLRSEISEHITTCSECSKSVKELAGLEDLFKAVKHEKILDPEPGLNAVLLHKVREEKSGLLDFMNTLVFRAFAAAAALVLVFGGYRTFLLDIDHINLRIASDTINSFESSEEARPSIPLIRYIAAKKLADGKDFRGAILLDSAVAAARRGAEDNLLEDYKFYVDKVLKDKVNERGILAYVDRAVFFVSDSLMNESLAFASAGTGMDYVAAILARADKAALEPEKEWPGVTSGAGREEMVREYLGAGKSAMKKLDFKKAALYFEKAGGDEGFFCAAWCFNQSGDGEKAGELAKNVGGGIYKEPAMVQEAEALELSGRPRESAELYEKLAGVFDDKVLSSASAIRAGYVYQYSLKDPGKAAAAYALAAEKDPGTGAKAYLRAALLKAERQSSGSIGGQEASAGAGPLKPLFRFGFDGYSLALDTRVKQEWPNRNYGKYSYLRLQDAEGYKHMPILKFGGLAERIPKGMEVKSASLVLYISEVTTTERGDVGVYELLNGPDDAAFGTRREWEIGPERGAVCWNYISFKDKKWSGGRNGPIKGLDYAVEPLATIKLDPDMLGKYMTVMLPPSVVNRWITEPGSNRGIILVSEGLKSGYYDIASAEATVMNRRPGLKLEYQPVSFKNAAK